MKEDGFAREVWELIRGSFAAATVEGSQGSEGGAG